MLRLCASSLFLLALITPALALDPGQHISQYAHNKWLIQDDLRGGHPTGLSQTVDGYLWIGTKTGLLRFDGTRFVMWHPLHGERLPSSEILSLTATRDGSLWIGTVQGLTRWKDDRLRTYSKSLVGLILEAQDSTIWFTQPQFSEHQMPLCHVVNENVRCYGAADGMPQFNVPVPILEDDPEHLWIGGDTALVRWKQGSHEIYRPPELKLNANIDGIVALAKTTDGALWVGIEKTGPGLGLQRFIDGRWTPFVTRGFNSSTLDVTCLLVDREGAIWVGTHRGLYRIHGQTAEHYGSADGLSGDLVWRLFEDREGTLWVATSGGLDRFRSNRVVSFTTHEGLSTTGIDSVLASRDGSIWVGESGALDRLKNGVVSSLRRGAGLPGDQVAALFEDRAGQLWVGVDDNLFIYALGRFSRVARASGAPTGLVLGITEDSDHNIWAEVNGPPRSLVQIRAGRIQQEFPAQQVPSARRVAADPRGGLWLGLNDGDLAHFDNGKVTRYRFAHDADARVFQLLPLEDGSVLAATTYGVIGCRGGRSVMLDKRNGLPCDAIYGIAFEDSGALWLYSQCGLLKVSAQNLQRWWTAPDSTLSTDSLDVFDGAQPARVSFNPASRSVDGKLWFVNGDSLQMVDVIHVAHNPVLPPVHIEEVIVDGKSYVPQDGLHLPARPRDLEIDYTALSLRVPQKVRFRYRLDGRDTEWHDAGTRRQASYTDLRPGEYRFRVIASNEDGVWNDVGTQSRFMVTPAWYQTRFFQFLAVLSLLIVLWVLYRLRMRQVAASITARYDERLAERMRIAQELHDTFLQTLQGSKLLADDALDPPQDLEHLRGAIGRLSGWIGRAMLEARAALNSLRVSIGQTNELAEDLRRATEDSPARRSMAVTFSVQGHAPDLHPAIRDEVFAIGCEAIRNAFMHSKGNLLTITLSYGENLTVLVRDNGVGIDSRILAAGKKGHFGLEGMRARATNIGGKLTITSLFNGGVEVNLIVPGKIIFKNSATGHLVFKGFWNS